MKSSTSARWWDLFAASLLLAALSTAAIRLNVTQWTDHLNLVTVLTGLGVLLGLALGQSIFSPRQVAVFALLYGLFAVSWQLGPALGVGVLWPERLISLAGRLINALGQLARQESLEDPLLFLSLMAGLFWVLSVYAGYNLTRHARPWQAILPTGLVLLIFQIYDPFVASRVWFLAGYLLFGILLLARLTYLRRHARWRQDRVPLPLYIGFDLARVALVATTLFVLVAWTIPVLADVLPFAEEAWQHVTQPWVAARDRLSKALAPLRRAVGTVAQYGYYGERLSLGQGPDLSETPIMTVEIPPYHIGIPRYYWRARVYDYYAGGQWVSSLSAKHPVTPADFDLTFPEEEERTTATLTFDLAVPMAILYTASQPLWVSRPADAYLAYNPDGTADLSTLYATPLLRAGEVYQTRFSFSAATVTQLRAAGTDYPLWVTDRYLGIPSTVTTRTLELARQIALPHDNPYDVVAAVTSYLRTNIQYSETIPPLPPPPAAGRITVSDVFTSALSETIPPLPPPAAGGGEREGQEPLDWFLFDLRQGFCNYYASAEVILLRSLGIPARLAVGFAQGERQDGGDAYLVRQRDAHAWPEVYFPGLGWVEFEPTSSQRSIHRPLGESPSDTAAGSAPPPPVGDAEGGFPDDQLDRIRDAEFDPAADLTRTTARWNLALSLGLILIFLVWRVSRRRNLPPLPILLEEGMSRLGLQPPTALRRWSCRVALTPLGRAYLELNYALSRLGKPPEPADTPAERAKALARLLPAAAGHAQQLLDEYHTTSYSPRLGNLLVAQQAARAIRNLSWQTRVRRLIFWRHESVSSASPEPEM